MKRRIGAHTSTAGGFELALERVRQIGGNCAQIFSSSPRVWQNAWETKLDAKKFIDQQKKLDVQPVFTHALYLINLASANPESVKKSVAALVAELKFDAAIGGGANGAGVIVHLGSHMGLGWEAVKNRVVDAIKQVLDSTPSNSTLLIENSAGQKGKICSDLSEIRWLIDQLKSPRIGWCFDTCHGFTAGYFLGEKMDFTEAAMGRGSATEKISELELWPTLKCIHVNDSKGGFASGLDRHENLGDGQIGIENFKFFLSQKEIENIPLVLEVPGLAGQGPDAENIQRLKNLL